MMRNVPLKICTVLLIVWYFMSIIGFGVHTCMGSQRSFVTSFISGMACEDVHPERNCCHSNEGCCSHHEEDDHEDEDNGSCCSNEYQVLDLTGTLSQDDYSELVPECNDNFNDICIAGLLTQTSFSPIDLNIIKYSHGPDSGNISRADVQSLLGIWRI